MEGIQKIGKVIVYKSLKFGSIFSLIGLIVKIHKAILFLKNSSHYLYSSLSQKSIEHLSQEKDKKPDIKNLKAVQFELLPFFDGEAPTAEKIHEFIESYNRRFWNRPIDVEGDGLLKLLRQRKLEMIHQGEEHYRCVLGRTIGIYGYFDPMFQKISFYAADRFAMSNDVDYQQIMLKHFAKWYEEVTAPPVLPESAAHYITSDYHIDSAPFS